MKETNTRTRMSSKPDECIICYEKLEESSPLECGHWLHFSCVEKHFKPECPICRAPLAIQVKGERPEPFVPFGIQFREEEETFVMEQIQSIHDNLDEYYIDEDGEVVYLSQNSDEENPYGDEYDYPDEESDSI